MSMHIAWFTMLTPSILSFKHLEGTCVLNTRATKLISKTTDVYYYGSSTMYGRRDAKQKHSRDQISLIQALGPEGTTRDASAAALFRRSSPGFGFGPVRRCRGRRRSSAALVAANLVRVAMSDQQRLHQRESPFVMYVSKVLLLSHVTKVTRLFDAADVFIRSDGR